MRGLDIPEFYALVEELFTPEEAALNNVLLRKPAAAEEIAGKMNRERNEVTEILERMADKGLCSVLKTSGVPLYQALPFMPHREDKVSGHEGHSRCQNHPGRQCHSHL